jgi:hypothetical protein
MLMCALITSAQAADELRVSPVPKEIRTEFKLSPFYTKYVNAGGMPIIASDKVSDFALLEARYLVEQVIGHRRDVLAAIAKNRVRLAIMAPTELTTDIPEHSDLTPKDHWDKRARGLGATDARPAVSCGEENLLGYPGDPYSVENILIHEFGHVIHERGMNVVDPTFDGRLRAAFEAAKREGLWKGTYAGSNHMEYWAEGTQSWFDTNRENDSEHNWVSTRAKLKTYDKRLVALLAEVYGDGEWRYVLPAKRSPPSLHLAGFDAARAPRFAWPERLAKGQDRTSEAPTFEIPAGGGSLPALAPNSRATWRSAGGGKATKIVFQNAASSTVVLDWMDFEGRPKTYFTLRRGEQAESATFAGHVWRAKDERGALLGYFVAGELPGTAVVKEPAKR